MVMITRPNARGRGRGRGQNLGLEASMTWMS